MDQKFNILLETAANHCNKGEFKQGIHLYSKYIELNPTDAKAHYRRGKAYFQLKDYNASISDLNKALSFAPNDPHLIGERGLIYFMAKKEQKAIADFDTAVELEPKNPFRYASRAFIKDRLNDLEGAKNDYQKAIELDPDDAISYNNLGLVLDKMGRRKQASQHFESAATIDPKNFGMSKNISDAATEKPNPQELPSELPPVSKAKSHQLDSFKSTLKSLLQSKEERSAFWKFIKQKFS